MANRRQPLAFLELASRATETSPRGGVRMDHPLGGSLVELLDGRLDLGVQLVGVRLGGVETVLMWILIAFLTARFRSRRLADCRPRFFAI